MAVTLSLPLHNCCNQFSYILQLRLRCRSADHCIAHDAAAAAAATVVPHACVSSWFGCKPDHFRWFVLLQLPNFNALFIVSLVAATMSISYSTIGWVSAVADGKAAAVSYAIAGNSTGRLMGIFNGLGTMVFAYGGHSVVLEIQVRWLQCVWSAQACSLS